MAHSRDVLRKQYYKEMLHHGAHALYYPPFSSQFKPGCCGYFGGDGDWNPILADLSNNILVMEKGFKPISANLQRKPVDESIRWGPKRSSDVIGKKMNLSAGSSIAGLPVEAKAVFEYWSKSDAGAILLTASPITKEGFFHEHVFVEWVLENAIQLLKLYPVLFTHDLWVVTTTFSTKYCSHTVWSDKSKRVHVGFAVKQAGVGGMGPSGTWYEDHENDSWEKYGNDNDPDSRVPLFIGQSFSFKKSLFSKEIKSKLVPLKDQNVYRSAGDHEDDGTSFVPLNEEEMFEITCTTVDGLEESSSN